MAIEISREGRGERGEEEKDVLRDTIGNTIRDLILYIYIYICKNFIGSELYWFAMKNANPLIFLFY